VPVAYQPKKLKPCCTTQINAMKNALATHVRGNHVRLLNLAVAAILGALALAPTLHAQPAGQQPPPATPPAKEKPANASVDRNPNLGSFYSMKFDGGSMTHLKQVWKEAFTNDNFVMTESARNMRLPPFEILNVRLTEVARSIAFLSQGALTVEVVDQSAVPAGNIWRIGTPTAAETSTVRMRAVATPYLFGGGTATLKRLLEAADKIERERLEYTQGEVMQGLLPKNRPTQITPLPEQKVVVLIGTENGIAGLESFIQASELAFAQSAKRFAGEK
jgi:hypothetical protein